MMTMRPGGCRSGQDHRSENEKQQNDALNHSRLETLSHDFVTMAREAFALGGFEASALF
jgi:hypothetical protein